MLTLHWLDPWASKKTLAHPNSDMEVKMSDETIYENKRIKVTKEFLQIDDEHCQIIDIYDAIHLIQRDWKGVFGFSAAILVIGRRKKGSGLSLFYFNAKNGVSSFIILF